MNLVDVALIGIVFLTAWAGWNRGFLYGFINLVIWLCSMATGLLFFENSSFLLQKFIPALVVWAKPLSFILLVFFSRIVLSFVLYHFLQKVPTNSHSTTANKALGILPGVIFGAVYAAIAATLLLSLPTANGVITEARKSSIAHQLSSPVAWLDEKFSPVFGEAAKETVGHFIKEPASDETVYLHYTTTDVHFRADLENKMLVLVNEERSRRGIGPLQFDPQLVPVARAHSKDMFARGYFSHYTLENKDPFERMKTAGVTFTAAGENLALGRTLKICHEGLMNSPGHKANILNPAFGRIGIGILDGGIYGLMISQEFRN